MPAQSLGFLQTWHHFQVQRPALVSAVKVWQQGFWRVFLVHFAASRAACVLEEWALGPKRCQTKAPPARAHTSGPSRRTGRRPPALDHATHGKAQGRGWITDTFLWRKDSVAVLSDPGRKSS